MSRINTSDVDLTWNDISVRAKVDWTWENDGIGAYEYWGAKCFDRGSNYIEVQELKAVEIQHTSTGEYFPVSPVWLRKHEDELVKQATDIISAEEGGEV
jgi:hypothetical protein